MKVCIYGAGAIGGHLGARLGAAGAEVSIVARGRQLKAIEDRGLVLRSADREVAARVFATSDPTKLGPQDIVFVAVKAPSLPQIVDGLCTVRGPDTAIVYALNGIPWWYFHGVAGERAERQMPLLDPGGRLWNEVGVEHTVGCVVYSANEIVEPGVILNRSPKRNRFIIGEPTGMVSSRVGAISRLLQEAGLEAPASTDIRADMWRKFLVGNMTLSVLATLTMSPADVLAGDPGMARLGRQMVDEGLTLAHGLGVDFGDFQAHQMLEPKNIPKGNRPSMLQDLELSRPLEIGAFISAVQLLAHEAGIPMPIFDTVAALLKMRAKTAGLWDYGE